MDLEAIAEKLAGKHNLTKEEYLTKRVSEVYPAAKNEERTYEFCEDEYDLLHRRVLIPKTQEYRTIGALDPIDHFIKLLREINPELKSSENFELIYLHETYHEGTSKETEGNYLTLVDLTLRNIKELKAAHRETDVTLYGGGLVATCIDAIWFCSEGDDIKLETLFKAIKQGYEDIQKSIPLS
jgi:hypothetical protein